jgi:hypothetical protein
VSQEQLAGLEIIAIEGDIARCMDTEKLVAALQHKCKKNDNSL